MTERQVEMTIGGMSCGHCVKSVSEALSALEGVQVEEVEIGSAKLGVDLQFTPQERLKTTVDDLGFEVLEIAPK